MFTAYAIKQKSTGMFLPALPPSQNRGGTWLEPRNCPIPRLFPSAMAAKVALGHWLSGKMYHETDQWGNYAGIGVKSVPTRNRNDMEVVEFELKEK